MNGHRAVHALVRVHATPVGVVHLPVSGGRCPAGVLFASISRLHRTAVLRELIFRALDGPLPESGVELPALLAPATPGFAGAASFGDPGSAPNLPAGTLPSALSGIASGNGIAVGGDGGLAGLGSEPPLSGSGRGERSDADRRACPITVAICTRERPADLKRCLDGLLRLGEPSLDLLVVDNAPSSCVTESLVRFSFPSVRYVKEERPGLNWARNRAVAAARGEILAFVGDDVVVDREWARAYTRLFRETPEVMAATGLLVPRVLDSAVQLHLEHFRASSDDFARRWWKIDRAGGERGAARFAGLGGFAPGVNMAFRRSVFRRTGLFDPALDAGTRTEGGGDREMIFRVLKEGHTVAREPRALVRYRSAQEERELRRQLEAHGLGHFAYVLRSCDAYPDERIGFAWSSLLRVGSRLPRLARCLWRGGFPPRLLFDELRKALFAPARYHLARKEAAAIEELMGRIELKDGLFAGPQKEVPTRRPLGGGAAGPLHREERMEWRVALEEDIPPSIEAAHVRRLDIDIRWCGRSLARATLAPAGRPVRRAELRDAIADALAPTAASLIRDTGSVDRAICIPALLRRRLS